MGSKTFTIDATGRAAGRVASEAAGLLRGKNDPSFAPHILSEIRVCVVNTRKLKFTGKKLEKNLVYSHSGYPGGLKEIPLKDVFAKDSRKVLRAAVLKMLPKNRLRKEMMRHLKIEA